MVVCSVLSLYMLAQMILAGETLRNRRRLVMLVHALRAVSDSAQYPSIVGLPLTNEIGVIGIAS